MNRDQDVTAQASRLHGEWAPTQPGDPALVEPTPVRRARDHAMSAGYNGFVVVAEHLIQIMGHKDHPIPFRVVVHFVVFHVERIAVPIVQHDLDRRYCRVQAVVKYQVVASGQFVGLP